MYLRYQCVLCWTRHRQFKTFIFIIVSPFIRLTKGVIKTYKTISHVFMGNTNLSRQLSSHLIIL